MKVKTKVKAGRDCGGGGTRLPPGTDIPQSEVQSAHLGADQGLRWPRLRRVRLIPQRGKDFEVRCACCAPS